jgi:NAD(P)-dependent dehydrogenase (short-subunit alcohol dehydrogenase family)
MDTATCQRRFVLEDQLAFARLSGDANPAHTDPTAARRTLFGQAVVHGMHSALWAMDAWAATLDGPARLTSIRCEFPRPIAVGAPADLALALHGEREATLEVSSGGTLATRVSLAWKLAGPPGDRAPRDAFPPSREPRDLAETDASAVEGALDLYLDAAAFRRIFPRLTERLEPSPIALLLATTRLVGVECPGLRSVFSELALTADDAAPAAVLTYKALAFERRFHRVTLGVSGGGLAGTIVAFFRPPPRQQVTCAESAARVTTGEFAGLRALVVGGSRGLGEVTAKLLAAGGAEVRITYRDGKTDAEAVASDIAARGGVAACSRLDVLAPEPGLRELTDVGWLPTHLCYFATPFIFAAVKGVFSPELFRGFCEYYVSGFVNTAEPLICRGLRHILYPSSVAVDERPAHMGEYAAAKAAGEAVCAFLEKTRKGVSVCAPRLPRLATDQTASLLPAGDLDPAPVMLDVLRRFRDAASSREFGMAGGNRSCAMRTS